MTEPLNIEGPLASDVVTKVEEYLKTPVTSDGDWPDITQKDVWDLYAIVEDIIEAKFQRDCDNDQVIDFAITSRKRGTLYAIVAPHKCDTDEDVLEMLSAQSTATAIIQQLSRYMEWPARKRIEAKRRTDKLQPLIDSLKVNSYDATASRIIGFMTSENVSIYVGRDEDVWTPLGLSCAELNSVSNETLGINGRREKIEDYLVLAGKTMNFI